MERRIFNFEEIFYSISILDWKLCIESCYLLINMLDVDTKIFMKAYEGKVELVTDLVDKNEKYVTLTDSVRETIFISCFSKLPFRY